MADFLQSTLFALPDAPAPMPEDAAARSAAVDPTRSILVQAPAGAGKTALLTQRYLALLAQVEEPEQILAITFTRAATAEMRGRILAALHAAQAQPTAQSNESPELPLARAALLHAEACGWQLLQQPHRLDVQTIDSLCLRFAHSQPILARLGGNLAPTADADALYAAAARRTIALLGRSASPALESALATLLLHRDNKLSDLEALLADMLARRDTWLGVLPLSSAQATDWHAIRLRLEEPFHQEHERVLNALMFQFQAMPTVVQELLALCHYCSGVLASSPADPKPGAADLRILRNFTSIPGFNARDQLSSAAMTNDTWLALAHLLLTTEHDWRKRWDKTVGFPAADKDPGKAERAAWKQRMQACSAALQQPQHGPQLLQLLCELRKLPNLHYSDVQWSVLRAAFIVLRRAAAELRLVFAETNSVDFTEIALAAESVLADDASMRGLLESERKHHLLIDEFQDTSRAQYRILAHLLREWAPGDGRTLFLVGDPLQSIYAFRQAEVALFHSTRAHGLPCGSASDPARMHPCHPLQLTHNFRSHQALVNALNQTFAAMFPQAASAGDAVAVADTDTFIPAQASALASATATATEPSLQLHPSFYIKADPGTSTLAYQLDAASVVRVVLEELQQAQAARLRGESEYKIAILVRSRTHLRSILPALRQARIPYRGVELEPLDQQPEVRDLLMLLRALLHTSDRVAWLSVLRAPWCGLTVADLHLLCGNDDPTLLRQAIPHRIANHVDHVPSPPLSSDGNHRLSRVWHILVEAQATRYNAGNHLSLSQWLERTWMALGGPACLDATARDNAETFLALLDQLHPSGVDLLRGDFARRLSKLCAAPDTTADEQFGVHVMTIHKAKGLGFQSVLLPGLESSSQAERNQLVLQIQRPMPGAASPIANPQLLLAPVPNSSGDGIDAILPWIRSVQKAQMQAERRRLFYVACTRARLTLHLFATVSVAHGEIAKPAADSLLAAAWPALEPQLAAAYGRRAGDAHDPPGTANTAQPKDAAAGLALAASAEVYPLSPTNALDRLPAQWPAIGLSPAGYPLATVGSADVGIPSTRTQPRSLFTRSSQGSLAARARGTARHALLEHLANLFATAGGDTTLSQLQLNSLTRVARQSFRRSAVSFTSELVASVVQQALAVATTSTGQWLLQPHPKALSESSWQMFDADGTVRTLRVDRCFLAGSTPADDSASPGCLWVIDYKTGSHTDDLASGETRPAWLRSQKEMWAPQLEAYATAIVAASAKASIKAVRYGLYFPELLELFTWE